MRTKRATAAARARQAVASAPAAIPVTCARCGSVAIHVRRKQPKTFRHYAHWLAWWTEAMKAICPHCSPLPEAKWPDYLGGKLVKPCGCGSATCPVPAFAARGAP